MCHKGGLFYPTQVAEVFMGVTENLNYIENIKIEIISKNYLETQREVLRSLLFSLLVLYWNFFFLTLRLSYTYI